MAALWPVMWAFKTAQSGGIASTVTSMLPVQPVDRRFFIVSVGALVADLVLALALREGLHLSVTLAAAISFIVVWFGAYFVHEYWTFKHAQSRASAGRLTRNLAASGVALACRVAVIFILESIHPPESAVLAAVYVIAGAGCSFTTNYLLNRFWVFSRK